MRNEFVNLIILAQVNGFIMFWINYEFVSMKILS